MSFDIRFLNLEEAGKYVGQSTRWMRRHWPDLVKAGVAMYRVPKDAKKGHLMFSKSSLDEWVESCRIRVENQAH